MSDVVADIALVESVDELDERWDDLPEEIRSSWVERIAGAFLRLAALGNRW